eukprot:522402-Pleurochrysis_carterae.AAC.1
MMKWVAAQNRARAAARPSGPAVARPSDSEAELSSNTNIPHQRLAGVGCRLCLSLLARTWLTPLPPATPAGIGSPLGKWS